MPASMLDPQTIRSWARLCVGALGRDRALLDSANVFPVPDGDTGTNLYLTTRGGAQAVAQMPPDADATALLAAWAHGALVGARGNSGTILAEWFRGLAVAAAQGTDLAHALDSAAQAAWHAVARPAPGTILTAAQAAAQAVARPGTAAPDSADGAGSGAERSADAPQGAPESAATSAGAAAPSGVAAIADAEEAVAAARQAAANSPAQLPQLAKAGRLDAGACGLVLVLDALRAALGDGSTAAPVAIGLDLSAAAGAANSNGSASPNGSADPNGRANPNSSVDPTPTADPTRGPDPVLGDYAEHGDGDEDEFEVMFTLWRPADAADFAPGQVAQELRAELGRIGDSVVVVGGAVGGCGGDTVWHAHVHVGDLDAARSLILRWGELGRVEQIQVRYLAVPDSDLTVFATASTPALADEFARGGAVVLANERLGSRSRASDEHPLSPDDLAQAALGSATGSVLLLAPGDAAFAAQVQRRVDELAAEADASGALADAGALPRVRVLPTATDVETEVALGVLAETEGQPPGQREAEVVDLLARTTTRRWDGAADSGAPAVPGGVAPSAGVVTALIDADVPDAVVAHLQHQYGDNLVLLATKRRGARVELAFSPDSGSGG